MPRKWSRTRIGTGFSLDEAVRIPRQMLELAPGALRCPHCGRWLQEMTGAGLGERVSLVACKGCGRSLVIREPGPEPWAAAP